MNRPRASRSPVRFGRPQHYQCRTKPTRARVNTGFLDGGADRLFSSVACRGRSPRARSYAARRRETATLSPCQRPPANAVYNPYVRRGEAEKKQIEPSAQSAGREYHYPEYQYLQIVHLAPRFLPINFTRSVPTPTGIRLHRVTEPLRSLERCHRTRISTTFRDWSIKLSSPHVIPLFVGARPTKSNATQRSVEPRKK